MIEWDSEKVGSLVSAFGGVRTMATALGHKHRSTVQKWVEAGTIPRWREPEIEKTAKREDVKLPRWFKI